MDEEDGMHQKNFAGRVNERRCAALARLAELPSTPKRLAEIVALHEKIIGNPEAARAIRTKKHGGKERRIQNWRLGIVSRAAA